MIEIALNFIKQFLTDELNTRLKLSAITQSVKIANINKDTNPDNKIYITLVNIEEERVLKNQNHYFKTNPTDDKFKIINPEIKLNLYILVSAQFETENYYEALKQISLVIKIFQGKNVFEKVDLVGDAGVLDTLILDMFPQTIDQNNSLWQTLGGNLVPSVMYKVRLLIVQDDRLLSEIHEIKTETFNLLNI